MARRLSLMTRVTAIIIIKIINTFATLHILTPFGVSGKNSAELAVAAARRCDGRVATAVISLYCGEASGEMCAVSREPENVSRTSVAFGVASLAILLTGFVTGSWVTTREPYRVPGTDGAYTAAAFRIGLWKICPTLRKTNSTTSEYTCTPCYLYYISVVSKVQDFTRFYWPANCSE